MKKIAGLLTIVFSALSVIGCQNSKPPTVNKSPVVLYQGAVELADKKFGLYYGDKFSNEVGVYYVVLSDAMCYLNGYGNPYMDSEGDMLVLEFHGRWQRTTLIHVFQMVPTLWVSQRLVSIE